MDRVHDHRVRYKLLNWTLTILFENQLACSEGRLSILWYSTIIVLGDPSLSLIAVLLQSNTFYLNFIIR